MNSITLQPGDNLSSLAQTHGVSVNDLVGANKDNTSALPDAKNPNLIIAGQKLNIPQPSVIQTTSSQRADTQANMAKLGNMTANNIGGTALPTPGNPGTGGSGAGGDAGTGAGGGKPIIDMNTGDIKDANGNIIGKTTDGIKKDQATAEGDPLSSVKGRIEEIKTSGEAQINNMKQTLTNLMASSDASTQARIQSIQAMYGQRVEALKETYKRLGAAKDAADFRNGVNRYTPEQGQGVLTDNEVQLQMKITDIYTKMNDAITKAQSAQSANDIKAFDTEFTKIENYQKEINTAISGLMKEATAYQNSLTKQMAEKNKADAGKVKEDMELSKRLAPAVASSIAGLATKKEKQAFIEKYAHENGLDPAILEGDVASYTGAGKPVKAKATPAGSKPKAGTAENPYVSGKFKYTDDDLGAVESAFTTGGKIGNVTFKGRDPQTGYVDVTLYKKMADNWVRSGALAKDFTAKFPPAKYVNPDDNATLPTYLQNTQKPK